MAVGAETCPQGPVGPRLSTNVKGARPRHPRISHLTFCHHSTSTSTKSYADKSNARRVAGLAALLTCGHVVRQASRASYCGNTGSAGASSCRNPIFWNSFQAGRGVGWRQLGGFPTPGDICLDHAPHVG
jgi:hypothetical protein